MMFQVQFIDFLIKYWVNIAILLCMFLIVIFIVTLIITLVEKRKSFAEKLEERKAAQVAITVDLENETVEKYFLYDTKKHNEKLKLDEFYLCFDKKFSDKLKNWLNHISRVTDYNKTRRETFIMYVNGHRVYYRAVLDSYVADSKKYFFTFTDITHQAEAFIKGKEEDDRNYYRLNSLDDLINEGNGKLEVADNNSNNFLIAIKYKESQFNDKGLKTDALTLMNSEINKEIKSIKLENDFIVAHTDDTFFVFIANIHNVFRFKRQLRSALIKKSGKHSFFTNFEYTITYYAGYTKVFKNELLSVEKALEAETAVDEALKKKQNIERIQYFDDRLRSMNNELRKKYIQIEEIINNSTFDLEFIPIIDTNTKELTGYQLRTMVPKELEMNYSDFALSLKRRSLRTAYYKQLFAKVLKHKEALNHPFYLTVDFDDLENVMEAYETNSEYSNIKFYFCLSFVRKPVEEYDLVDIEKQISNRKVKFGLAYNSTNTIYLNEKIYSRIKVVLLSGKFIDHVLESFKNESLLDVYTQIANTYKQEVIGLNVKSYAIYEILYHYKVHKLGGPLLTSYVSNEQNKIIEKSFLKKLDEIEQRKY